MCFLLSRVRNINARAAARAALARCSRSVRAAFAFCNMCQRRKRFSLAYSASPVGPLGFQPFTVFDRWVFDRWVFDRRMALVPALAHAIVPAAVVGAPAAGAPAARPAAEGEVIFLAKKSAILMEQRMRKSHTPAMVTNTVAAWEAGSAIEKAALQLRVSGSNPALWTEVRQQIAANMYAAKQERREQIKAEEKAQRKQQAGLERKTCAQVPP